MENSLTKTCKMQYFNMSSVRLLLHRKSLYIFFVFNMSSVRLLLPFVDGKFVFEETKYVLFLFCSIPNLKKYPCYVLHNVDKTKSELSHHETTLYAS